jgi:hypothetical protein
MSLDHRHDERLEPGVLVTKAVTRAADRLGLSARILAATIGVSEASVSRMRSGTYLLDPASKPFELAVLLVRLFRSLDAIVGGDEAVMRMWMIQPNTALGARPVDTMQTVAGLLDVIAYLDARRAGL